MHTIFVNIASYRDNLLLETLTSLIKNESGRNKIVYGVFEQIDLNDSLPVKEKDFFDSLSNEGKIRYKRMDPTFSDGVTWARSINSMQVYDEEFMYQVDSHMFFDKDWDHYLILDYNQAREIAKTDKIILTTGTKNFEIFKNQITKHVMSKDVTVKFGYWQFEKNLTLRVHGAWIPATDVVTPSIHTIAGNFFVPTTWLKDVGYNTNLFFDKEEQYMSISSILAGYKIYHQRKIKCYHYLHSAKHRSKIDINPVIDTERIKKNRERETKEFIRYIYSLGEEKLNEFFRLTGVDYINKKLEERAISRTATPNIEIDWEIENQSDNLDNLT